MRYIRTLKFKILSICLSLSLLLTFLLSFVIYRDMRQSYILRETEYSSYNMKMVMNNIDRDYYQIVNFLLWMSSSRDITNFLTHQGDDPGEADMLKVTAHKSMQTQIRSMDLTAAVDKCVIVSTNGDHIIVGKNYGDTSDLAIIESYAIDLSASVQMGGITASPFLWGRDTTGILLSCGVYNNSFTQRLGGSYLFMSAEILDDQFARYLAADGSRMYLSTERGYYPIEDNVLSNSPTGEDLQLSDILPIDLKSGTYSATATIGGKDSKALIMRSTLLQWDLIKVLPEYTINDISEDLSVMLLILGSIIFGSFAMLLLLLVHFINKPVQRIVGRIKLISTGDFSRDASIETGDELGYIGTGINNMSQEIEKLIEAYLEEQQQKKNYEFKVLQTQINPHFLYNTLNSIKWMASIQKAKGIGEMVSTLGHMLRLIAKVNAEVITLEQELEFVKDYIVIQSYRYGDSFSMVYDIEEECLRRAKVIKFTIQPLVENAIFHGIEPKNTTSEIRIHAYRRGGDLLIEVTDDGIGLSPEKVEKLNRFSQETTKERNNIGLYNIHHRIQLEYGESYGLHVESAQGRYTKVTITMPCELAEGEALSGAPSGE